MTLLTWKRWTEEQELLRLRNEGWNLRQLSKALNRSEAAIDGRLRKLKQSDTRGPTRISDEHGHA